MPGRVGNKMATVWKLPVLKVDTAANCIWVKGCVPGPVRREIRIMDSWSNRIFKDCPPPFPTYIPDAAKPIPVELHPNPKHFGKGLYNIKSSPERAVIR
jgi:hypothetical protein